MIKKEPLSHIFLKLETRDASFFSKTPKTKSASEIFFIEVSIPFFSITSSVSLIPAESKIENLFD